MKSKSYPALFGLVVALILQAGQTGQAGSADLQRTSQAAGKVKLVRTPNGGL
jgi:hypothetical protein